MSDWSRPAIQVPEIVRTRALDSARHAAGRAPGGSVSDASWEQLEGEGVGGSDDGEVASVEGGYLGYAEPLGYGYD